MTFGYGDKLRAYDEYWAREEPLPANASKDTDSLRVGASQGSLTLNINAASAVTLPAAGTATFEILESDEDGGPFAIHPKAPVFTFTGAGSGTTYAAGEAMGCMALPDCKRFVKIRITTDASATGSVDVWKGYLAR